jgi:hypothetical protein
MKSHIKVEGHNNLVRDRRTGVLLNTNKAEIDKARKISKSNQEKQNHIEYLSKEVKGLKEDMTQIKELLFRLVEDRDEQQ